jgi:hypothetical protein
MAECDLINTCIFFNDKMANTPSTAEIFKTLYCRGDSEKCARMMVVKAAGREKVPADLFPNQADRVAGIVGKG